MGLSKEDVRKQRMIHDYMWQEELYMIALEKGLPVKNECGFINRMAEYLKSPRRRIMPWMM